MTNVNTVLWLVGGGSAGERIRQIDWAATPLGPSEDWPVALKVAAQMMLASAFPKAIFWGPQMVTLHNDAFRPILGQKPCALGRSFYDIWAEVWPEVGPIAERAFNGEATFIEDFPLVIERNGYPEPCNFTFCYSPIRDAEGRVGGVMDTVIETTGKVAAERQLEIRNAELAHRIKNTLSVVNVIVRQTLRSASSTEAAWAVLSQRLEALAGTHEILFANGGSGVSARMAKVVAVALRPHGAVSGRFRIDGPDVGLDRTQALALALVVNELATNAIKHGALSVEGGRVDIGWKVEPAGDSRMIRFHWTESGGPAVTPPERSSFGSQLLTVVGPQDFGGEAEMDFAPGGLSYRLSGRHLETV